MTTTRASPTSAARRPCSRWRVATADRPDLRPPGRRYTFGWGSSSRKLTGPAIAAADLGSIDAVLLSHDHHGDNLDTAGRALLPAAGVVLTTVAGGLRAERGRQPAGQAAGVAATGGHRGGGTRDRMRLLTRLPLAAALVVSLAAGLLSPTAATLCATQLTDRAVGAALLVRLPSWPERDPPDPPVRIASWAWVVAGVVVGLGFVLVLGPSLGSFAGYSIAR
jgi:hypothetical protein